MPFQLHVNFAFGHCNLMRETTQTSFIDIVKVFYLKNWLQTSWWSNYHRKNNEMYFLTCRLFVQLRWRNGRGSWMCHPKVTWLPLLQKVWNCPSSVKEVARPDDQGARFASEYPAKSYPCMAGFVFADPEVVHDTLLIASWVPLFLIRTLFG